MKVNRGSVDEAARKGSMVRESMVKQLEVQSCDFMEEKEK